jgi:hypothetical protein
MAIEPSTARDLTDEEQEARAEFCTDLEDKIKGNLNGVRTNLWDLAHHLYEFDQEEGWSALGYETQQEWLAQPEIGMTRSAYFALVRRHRELVVVRQLPPATLAELDPSKVDIVMAAIEHNRGKLEDILDDVKTLGARDLRDNYVKNRKHAPRNTPGPQGGAVAADGTGAEDPDIVEGTATTVEETKEEKEFRHATAVVDSWLEMGGDKRKAKRQWERFKDLLPIFHYVGMIDEIMESKGRAPRADAYGAWVQLCELLDLHPEAVDE